MADAITRFSLSMWFEVLEAALRKFGANENKIRNSLERRPGLEHLDRKRNLRNGLSLHHVDSQLFYDLNENALLFCHCFLVYAN